MKTINDYKDFGEFVEDFRNEIYNNGCKFLYKKKNGKLRLADGYTLSKDGFTSVNNTIFCYWDVDCKDYRSFREVNLLGFYEED